MKCLILILLFHFHFSYYSFKLNDLNISRKIKRNNTINKGIAKNLTKQQILDLQADNELPLNSSFFNKLNNTYIKAKNIKSKIYSIDTYFGSNKQYLRLLLSTFDLYTTVASKDCKSCAVNNKYNPSLSNKKMKILVKHNNKKENYKIILDSCEIGTESAKNGIIQKNNLTIDELAFKVLDSKESRFPNSKLVDGILSLSYNSKTKIPNNNFIMELYNEGKISSPSFSIIVTSSHMSRLYIGDILKNEYVRNYVNLSMNKGECDIIDNKWQCKVKYVKYTDFRYSRSNSKERDDSIVKFSLNENLLILPEKYYETMIVGYRYESQKVGDSYTYVKKYNKLCSDYDGIIYCSCPSMRSFGAMTFQFKNGSKLDVKIEDYVTYDNTAYFYKCRVDVALVSENIFVVGLRGLNNTILSFDMEDKKIKFLHKKKTLINRSYWLLIVIVFFVIFILFIKANER